MSRPLKGETWNTEKHYGCRVLKYPVGESLTRIANEKNRRFGSLCNAVTKDALTTADENYSFSPRTAAVILGRVSAENPKMEFTLYLTDEEHEKLGSVSSALGLSLNQLVICFLREYVQKHGFEI